MWAAGLQQQALRATPACRSVHCARPVKNAADSSSGYTVAMDSEDRQRVQQDLQARLGLRCAPMPFSSTIAHVLLSGPLS